MCVHEVAGYWVKDRLSVAELSKGDKLEKQNKLYGNFSLHQNAIYCFIIKKPVTTFALWLTSYSSKISQHLSLIFI